MKSILKVTWDLFKFLILVILAAFIFKAVLFQPFVVDGNSMESNYHDKEYILVNKLVYYLEKPERADVIILRPPDNPNYTYIKRVIGLPGETIKISHSRVYINNQLLEEKYLPIEEKTLIGSDEKMALERTLAKNEYFVMGDNRDHSTDSRDFGVLPRENIVGRAWLILYPTQYFGLAKHNGYSLVPAF